MSGPEPPGASPYADAVYRRLLESLPRGAGGGRAWQVADPYLLRHVAQHAVRARRVDELLLDAAYLAEADPESVSAVLGSAASREARVAAAVYRTSYTTHRHLPPHQRRQVLALDAARCQAAGLADDLAHGGDWRYLWATRQHASTALTGTLEGHTHEVTAVAPAVLDGRPVAATSSHDGTVRVRDLATGLTTRTLTGHTSPVTGVAVADLGARPVVVSASWDGTARVWDLATGEVLLVEDGHAGPLTGVAVAEFDGRTAVVTVTYRGLLRVWDLRAAVTGGAGARIGHVVRAHPEPVTSVAAATLAGWPVAVTTGVDGTARAWDLDARGGALVPGVTLTGHTGWVLGAALTLIDGRPVAVTAGRDGTARVWDLANGRVRTVLEGHTDWVTAVAAAHLDGRTVAATSSRDGTARLWDLATGHIAATTTVSHPPEQLSAVAVADLAAWPVVVTAGYGGAAQVWDMSARSGAERLEGHTGRVSGAATAPVALPAEGPALAVTASQDRTARVWDLDGGRTTVVLEGHAGAVTAVATVRTGGRTVAVTGSTDGTARVWDLVGGRTVALLKHHTDAVRAVAAAELNGRALALTAGDDRRVVVWDVDTRRPVQVVHHGVRAMDVALVGDWLTGVFADEDRLWAQNLSVADGGFPRQEYDPEYDGGGPTVLARRSPPVTVVRTATHGGRPVAVTGGEDGSVRLWDLQDGGARTSPEGHSSSVTGVATAVLDGATWVLTTGYDRTVRVWDVTRGRCLDPLALPDVPHSIAAGPDGRLVLGMGNEVVALAHLTTGGIRT